jgi:hypothetical protein
MTADTEFEDPIDAWHREEARRKASHKPLDEKGRALLAAS